MYRREKMKKKVLSLLLTGAMIAAMLTGCGNADANTDSSSGETDQTESTEAAETGKAVSYTHLADAGSGSIW